MSDEEKQQLEQEFQYALDNIVSKIKGETATAIVVSEQSMILLFKKLMLKIEKQSKEIEEYKKQLDLDYVDKHFVPIERYNQLKKEIEELKDKNEKYKNPPFFDEENYTSNDKIKAKIEELDLAVFKNQTIYTVNKMQEIKFARLCLAELLEKE